MDKINKIYSILKTHYGPQGWWPLLEVNGSNPTKTGSSKGYHPGDYSYPKDDKQRFEICIGAILTQNTSWPQVEKALMNLKKINCLDARHILKADEETIKAAIKPAGYFNQKARKLKIFSNFFLALKGAVPSRDQLLDLWGIGPETADSMLLYAYKKPEFVIDAYTKRIASRLGLTDEKSDYHEIRSLFESGLIKDYKTYQEYHALLVEHAKRSCAKKPACENCVLKRMCNFSDQARH